jgi:hypothetical protein
MEFFMGKTKEEKKKEAEERIKIAAEKIRKGREELKAAERAIEFLNDSAKAYKFKNRLKIIIGAIILKEISNAGSTLAPDLIDLLNKNAPKSDANIFSTLKAIPAPPVVEKKEEDQVIPPPPAKEDEEPKADEAETQPETETQEEYIFSRSMKDYFRKSAIVEKKGMDFYERNLQPGGDFEKVTAIEYFDSLPIDAEN